MRKLLALVLAVMMMFSCASFAMADEAAGENTVTIAMETSPNLDTHWNAGATGALLMAQMYEGLYRVTATGIELAGAESVDVSDDATVWTFHLRQDAVWNDGKPVTAADYVYSMQRLVDPAIATTYMRDYGQFLKNGTAISDGTMEVSELGVKAVDDYTLEITLEQPCTYFDTILTYSTFYPLRSDCVEEDGTGNWAWDVSQVHHQRLHEHGSLRRGSGDRTGEEPDLLWQGQRCAGQAGSKADRRHKHHAVHAGDRRC